jgi:predicted adenine nucleotide alpha hydrolase (AANH) superfamily ATPase
MEWMLNNGIAPVLYFFNPNIHPFDEYLKRKEECMRYAESLGVAFIDGDYEHDRWLEGVAGLENQPERGSRCAECFRMRLKATAQIASQQHISLFTTTLMGSRWKSYRQIVEAGRWAASFAEGIGFWDKDWKKGGLTERRKMLLQENGFYNQQYCGCEFSIRK